MKLLNSFFLVSLFLFFQPSVKAQDTGKLILNIFPRDAFIKIDGNLIHLDTIKQPYTIQMSVGKYPVQIWASKLELFQGEVEVKASKPTVYNKNITKNYSQSFLDYEEKKKAIKDSRTSVFPVIGSILIINAGYNLLNRLNRKNLFSRLDDLETARIRYIKSVYAAEAIESKNVYDSLYKKYERKRKNHNIRTIGAIPLLIGSSFISFKVLKKHKANKPEKLPHFEDVSPFSYFEFRLDNEVMVGQSYSTFNASFHF